MGQTNEKTDKRSYKSTLNLPRTAFAMKANLVQREPAFQKRWAKMDLYQRMRNTEHPAGPFVFHDGPPYANGDIHMGHLLNKVLKDLVVRCRMMAGHDVHFVPGWDCHGLPIEHKVMKDLGDKARDLDAVAIRRQCQKDAGRYVKLQARQMERLGTTGDYADPYITMAPQYEAGVLEVFAELVGRELVYRALKPVHWSIANRTALADAELEYYDREDTSVYVLFDLVDASVLPDGLCAPSDKPVGLMIWTTTPWTLPANLAVAVAPAALYGLYRFNLNGRTHHALLADALHEKVLAAGGATDIVKLGDCTGNELVAAGPQYRHPFINRISPLVTADYVTLEDGTGLVHTAPGHGVEDYQTGLKQGIGFADEVSRDRVVVNVFNHRPGVQADTYCPVLEDGTFDDTVPDWLGGRSVWEANDLVVNRLRESGHLFHAHQFTHSYPHDWRSKTPVIFRATEQWFISVDRPFGIGGAGQTRQSLRNRALDVTASDVRFIPDWGRNRMRGMLESRPDWCISRQRAWGLPIPAFQNAQGEVLLTRASVQAVADNIRKHGSDMWFKAPPADLLAGYDLENDDDAPRWLKDEGAGALQSLEKSRDIFDVWFESGSSWYAVMVQRGLAREQGPVTDLYLEGSDQHRGWFQLSLLPCLGVRGTSPFESVLTHGFMVDAQGQKMSKSGGNAIAVEDLLREHGADVCRWWVASLSYANDIKVDWEFFRIAGEEYRKVRNTIRFLLSNLNDFDHAKDRRPLRAEDRCSLDAWVWSQWAQLVQTARQGYEQYNFRRVSEAIFNFCNETLSAVYLAAVKDRLYCDPPASDRRRRAQTVMHDMAEGLIRLLAPILVHTADEAWLALHGENPDKPATEDSVHLHHLPEPLTTDADPAWEQVMRLRDQVLKALEDARAHRGLDNPLDAGIEVALPAETHTQLKVFEDELADLCGVSRFVLDENGEMTIGVEDLTHEPRCERSWKRDGTVRQRSDGGWLSDRDAEAVGVE
jgi:isoleucyl-tRNA synthetase